MNKLFTLVISFFATIYVNAQVVINEIMQSNIDCYVDDLNDFPDSWVELYNAGTETVNLSEYSLGTSDKPAKAWKLPSETLAAKCYVIICCDKAADDWAAYPSSKRNSKNWHATFRLESGKDCKLFLFKNGEVVDQLPEGMKKQPAPNIAYGRKTDGEDEWGYQETPTPKATNCGTVYSNKDILGDPVFSIPGKVYTEAGTISLTISLPEDAPEGTVIRYTTDGSEPTEKSQVFTSPYNFSDNKVIRAKLFCKGKLSPRSVTQSYIKHPRKVTLPVVSIVSDNRYLTTDQSFGILISGNYGGNQKNYQYNWRRPINFEYFEDADSKSELNQHCEARVTGGASRDAALKSLGIYANKRFGEKRLGYEFFPDQRPGVTNFKSIMMRNSGNDFDYLYMRDAVIQRIMAENVDIDWQAWRPVIFYLNGEYKGMLNIRERSNEDNIYTNYKNEKGDDGLEDIDMIENWNELKEGTIDNWNAFKAFYNEHGHTYEEYDKLMDVTEFINVMILNLFYCNLDFPGNNFVMWRPQAEGGRWRVVVKDTDFGLGLYGRSSDYKTLEWIHNPSYDSGNAWANQYEQTRLFRRLEEDETFLREFIDRFAIYMGDFMNYDRTWEVWQPMYNMIKFEYPYFKESCPPSWWNNIWGKYNVSDSYQKELSNAQKWLKERVPNMYKQLSNYYKLPSPSTLCINRSMMKSDLGKIAVYFNGVRLTRSCFDGQFFTGRQVELKGENVVGWEVYVVDTNGVSSTKTMTGDTYTFTMPACKSVAITAMIGDTAIESVLSGDSQSDIQDIFDLSGSRRENLGNGINIIRTKDGKSKTIWY